MIDPSLFGPEMDAIGGNAPIEVFTLFGVKTMSRPSSEVINIEFDSILKSRTRVPIGICSTDSTAFNSLTLMWKRDSAFSDPIIRSPLSHDVPFPRFWVRGAICEGAIDGVQKKIGSSKP